MAAHAPRIRALSPADITRPLDVQHLGDLLQKLIAHGDRDWVEGLTDVVAHRVRWVLERDARPKPLKARRR